MTTKLLAPLAFLALSATALLAPAPAAAGCFCAAEVYTTEPASGTWGMGADCTAAHNDLINNLNNLILCDESPCNIQFVQKSACFLYQGMMREDAVYNYRCLRCVDRDPLGY